MTGRALFDLTGKTALVTGASRGMGLAMARALAEHGARVVISARQPEPLRIAADAINDAIGETRAFPVACNVGRQDDLDALVRETHDAIGGVDILLGNAGVNPYFGKMAEIPDAAYEKTMRSNVQSNLWLARRVAPDMIAKGSGAMMFTSSIGAFKASDTLGVYGMSKLALIGLVRNLAKEWGPSGIRVNAICPGVIRTDFARALWDSPDAEARARRDIPLQRFGEPEDLAGLAVYLASDASAYMTGQALTVCGGSNMWA